MATPRVLSTTEAVARLGIARATLYAFVDQGRITPVAQARGRRGARFFAADDIDRLARERAAELRALADRIEHGEMAS